MYCMLLHKSKQTVGKKYKKALKYDYDQANLLSQIINQSIVLVRARETQPHMLTCKLYTYSVTLSKNTKTIRIYHECEGRIEKTRPKYRRGDPEGWTFLSRPHTNNIFFFLLTIKYRILCL